MEKEEIRLILENQRRYFTSGATKPYAARIETLKKLRALILQHETQIAEALWKDFRKPGFEVMATETRFVLKELNHSIRNLRRWMKKKHVPTPIIHFPAYSFIFPQPYGQVLVLSPWNFPFQLAFLPIVGALAAGNCVVLKASAQVPNTSAVMKKILDEFLPELIVQIEGGHSVSDFLLDQKFDYIFFTGSPKVGRYVMQKAAVHLTPVSLELGGKNPCVVAADAKLDFAAKRIAWGKLINSGQTCVSPDYILVDRKVKDQFLMLLTKEIRHFYGENPEVSNDFARVISAESVNRLSSYLTSGEIVLGGKFDSSSCYMEPTILKNVQPDDPVMKDEIFGPVFPVIDFEQFEDVYAIIEKNAKPLGAYIFSTSRKRIRDFLLRTQSGTSSVNETVMQIASPYLPYGGIGPSGIGRYHGQKSFETFSNMRSVLVKSNRLDIWLRYPPYSKLKTRIVSFLMR